MPKTAGEKRPAAKRTAPVERTLYVVFQPGTDPEFIKQVKESIRTLTGNGRVVIDAFRQGDQMPILPLTVDVERRPRVAGAPELPAA
jgi:hypothetical protein